ncbi:hypothetical protein J3458_013310 [Metarhizium acridum]|uniref:uncharacterized protein n=1 Tax=Metarhizium acridum TaxID=92637 RepID=UPI001C6D036D|nr:hypothetical protein J3458_013310 [Metarhizium acridum]
MSHHSEASFLPFHDSTLLFKRKLEELGGTVVAASKTINQGLHANEHATIRPEPGALLLRCPRHRRRLPTLISYTAPPNGEDVTASILSARVQSFPHWLPAQRGR